MNDPQYSVHCFQQGAANQGTCVTINNNKNNFEGKKKVKNTKVTKL